MQFCELRGWRHACSLGLHQHHIINKSSLRGCPEARRFVEKYPEFFLATVCGAANISRLADTKEARAFLIRKRLSLWGQDYCEEMLEGLRGLTKSRPEEWRLEALLSAA